MSAARKTKRAPKRGRKRAKRRGGALRLVFRALGLLVVLAIAALAWLLLAYPRSGGGARVESVVVRIAEGATVEEITAELGREGLVEHPRVFAVYLRLRGFAGSLRRGEVLLARGLTPARLAGRLDGRRVDHLVRVTFPEGSHRWDMARRLEDAGVCDVPAFLEASEGAEGTLFPDTYEFRIQRDPARVVAPGCVFAGSPTRAREVPNPTV